MPDLSPDSRLLESLLPAVESVARSAGAEIMKVYEAGFSVTDKADKTPVTEADYAAHAIIVKGLEGIDPQFPVLSEESENITFEERSQWQTYWLVDPLDGTREFIKRNGEFSVNIALIHEGEPVLGLVYAPVLEHVYFASKGNGAYKRCDGGEENPIQVGKAAPPYRIAASRSHPSQRMDAYLSCLGSHSIVPMGSSLKSCLVAEGKADLYPRLGLTSEWDTAACQCVVEEAGGHILTTQGERLSYNTKESLLNPEFFVFGDADMDWLGLLSGE